MLIETTRRTSLACARNQSDALANRRKILSASARDDKGIQRRNRLEKLVSTNDCPDSEKIASQSVTSLVAGVTTVILFVGAGGVQDLKRSYEIQRGDAIDNNSVRGTMSRVGAG